MASKQAYDFGEAWLRIPSAEPERVVPPLLRHVIEKSSSIRKV